MPTPKQKPIVSFPTPNIRDSYFVEFVNPTLPYYNQFEFGAFHPDHDAFPGARLTYRAPVPTQDGEDKLARMVWCSARGAQEVYNAKLKYSEGDINYPIHTRQYVFLRSEYEAEGPALKLTPLGALTGLELNSGGLNYVPDSFGHVDLVFTGGGGTGAAGFGTVVDGVFTDVFLTDTGANYTSAPTVTAIIGAGLSVTVRMQAQTELLIAEESGPLDGELSSIWMEVIRVYETLPGPEIANPHFDPQTYTERTLYEQRVVIGTPPNPVAAVQIFQSAVGNPSIVTTMKPHGIPIGDTFDIRIAGTTGGTPDPDGDHVATSTGTGTFTIPVNITVATAQFSGFASVMKNAQVIIDSYVKPDDGAGAVVGTLYTLCATLPGREVSSAKFDTERAAYVTSYRQYVHLGFGDWFALGTYRGQTIEDSNDAPVTAGMALLTTHTILLPGNAVTTLSFDEALGVVRKTIVTRVAIGSSPDTIALGAAPTSAGFFTSQSRIVVENSVVGKKITQQISRPAGWTETVNGSEPMPNIFTYVTGWTIGNTAFYEQGPFLGVNYLLQKHSVASPLLCAHTFTWGIDNTVFSTFSVLSGRSRYFPIDGLTLHNTYLLDEVNPSTAAVQTIELMFQSDPAPGSYVTGTLVVVNVTNEPYEGGPDGLWVRKSYYARCT
jgi:hypothetical protein